MTDWVTDCVSQLPLSRAVSEGESERVRMSECREREAACVSVCGCV